MLFVVKEEWISAQWIIILDCFGFINSFGVSYLINIVTVFDFTPGKHT